MLKFLYFTVCKNWKLKNVKVRMVAFKCTKEFVKVCVVP